jgi:hypothetical protein
MELTEDEYIEQLDELELYKIQPSNRKQRFWVHDDSPDKTWSRAQNTDKPMLHVTSNHYKSESTDKTDWVDIIRVNAYNVPGSNEEVEICVCGNPKTTRINHNRSGGPKTYTDALRAVAVAKARVKAAYEQMQQEKG